MSQNFTKSKWPSRLFLCALAVFTGGLTSVKAQLAMTRSSFTGTYTPITTGGGATTTTITSDDGVQGSIPIGFSFNYLGTGYSNLAISANGWVSFNATTTSSSFSNTDMYTTSGPNLALFPWFDDLTAAISSVSGAPSILYQLQGTPGSQTFTVQWTNMCAYRTAGGSAINFQVILYEGTNVIEFRYGTRTVGTQLTGQSASIGIENGTGGPGNYMDAMTGSSKCGHFYLTEQQWPQYFFRFTPGAPAVLAGGTYNVGVGQIYPNLTEALCDIQQRGISGPVTFNLTDAAYDTSAANGSNFFPLLLGPVTGSSAANNITIMKSGSPAVISWGGVISGSTNGAMMGGTTSSINGSNVEPILGLVGADFVTVNNIALNGNVGAKNADHAIGVYNNTATDGSTNNAFTNISITMRRANTGSRAIVQNVTTTPTSAAGANSNNVFKNLNIQNVYAGVQLTGNSSFPDLNTEVGTTSCNTYNTIGNPGTANDIGNGGSQTYGVRATNQSAVKIYNNIIRNVTGSAVQTDGIFLETFQGLSQVYNNKIQTVRNSSTSSTTAISGIRASHATTGTNTARIYNNAISEITSAYTGSATATRTLKGIFISGSGGGTTQTYEIYNNTVSIDGSASPNLSNTCFEISTVTGPVYTLGNNIFANYTAAQTGVAHHYALVSNSATAFGNTGTTSNNNDLFIANDGGVSGYVGLGSATNYATVANWTAGMTGTPGLETASLAVDPLFVSSVSDLHSNSGLLNNVGLTAPAYITTDIECAARTDKDLGAYINVVPNCAGTPAAGTITGISTLCSGNGTTLSLSGGSTDVGISYQWASSTTSGGPYTNMGTAISQATGTLSATTYYVVTTTCSFSSMTSTTPEFTLTVNPIPTVTASPSTATICSPGGSAVTLTASGTATTYTWSPAAGLSATTGASVTANPTSTTTYTLTGVDGVGCSNTSTAVVTVAPKVYLSAVTATPPNVCSGGSTSLMATAGTTSAYTVTSIPYAPVADPGTGTSVVSGDDNVSAAIALPFTFSFYGVAYTQLFAYSNGFVQLGTSSGSTTTYAPTMPTAANPNAVIAGVWSDLNIVSGAVRTYTTGTPGSQIFTVHYASCNFYNTIGNVDFYIQLFEADQHIEIHLNDVTGSSTTTANKTLGIENATGTAAVTPAGRNAANWNVTGGTHEAWKFMPTGGTFTYLWSESPAAGTLTSTTTNPAPATNILTDATYTVVVTDASGCSATGNVTVTAGAALVCTGITSSTSTYCSGNSFTLTASSTGGGAPFTYAWSDGVGGVYPATASISPVLSTAGTYTFTVTITDACGATCSNNITINVNASPVVTVTPTTASICNPGGSPIILNATGPLAFTWSPATGLSATTGATVTANPTATTTYTVSNTDALGCIGSATATITVGPTVVVSSVTATPPFICTGANSQLNISAAASITAAGYMFSASTGATLDPMTGATTVIGTGDDDAPTSAPAAIGFTFHYEGTDYTQYSISPDGWILLGGATAVNQFTNAVTSTTNVPKIYPFWDDVATGTTGNVKVLVTGTAPNRIFIAQWFVTVPRNTTGAANSTFQAWLYETSNKIEFRYGTMGTPTSGTISGGLTGATSTNFSSLTYSTNTVSASTPNDGNAIAPPSGTMYTFSYPTLTYAWTPSTFIAGQETLPNPMATAVTSTTTYNVTASLGACSTSGSVTVSAGVPLVCGPITTGSPVCSNQDFTLSLSPAGGGAPYTYVWSDGIGGVYPNTSTITANLPAGTYSFSVTVTDACSNTCNSNVSVTVNPGPAGTAGGPATGVTYQNLTYTVTGYPVGATFQWQSATVSGGPYTNIVGATNDSLVISKNAAGTFYYVCVITLGSCTITSNQVTTVITIAGDDVCSAIPLTFGLNGPFTNVGATTQAGEVVPPLTSCNGQSSWCSGSSISNTVWFTFVAPPSGKASLHFILPNWDSEIAVWDAPNCGALLTGGATMVAANDDSSGSPYNAYIDVTCLTPGHTYYVQVDGYGTTTNSNFKLLLESHSNAAPTISGMPADMTLSNDPGSCGAVVTWTAPALTDPDNCVASMTSLTSDHNSGDLFPIGTTMVIYTGTDGVNTVTDTFNITVNDTEFPVFSGCLSDTTIAHYSPGCSAVYTWTAPTVSDNCATPSLTASHTSGFAFPLGTTTVTYTSTDVNGNTSTCSFNVTVTTDLVTTVNTVTNEACNGDTSGSIDVSVSGTATPYTYDWSNDGTGDTDDTQDLSGLAAGAYTLVVADASGCSDTTAVTITEPTAITSSQTLTICNGTSITVGTHTYSVPGTYMDVFTATNGCDSTVTTILNVNPPVNIGTSVSGVNITASSSSGTYQWINCATNSPIPGATGQIFVAASNGSYAVIVTESGCSDTSTCVVINVGINELQNNQSFGLYPNPTTGQFTLASSTEARMTLVNALGEQLMTGKLNKGDNKFDAGAFARGVYMIRITDVNGNLLTTQRLTITR